ncbi:MAG TPA: pitrilysin family protein [Candidatus Saccharimonadales bacterium]|nr:pitrilysin family protein [Candidatus Saccharimonadales bacterium]
MKHTVTEITLKNGAKGLLIHIPDASVMSLEFNFRAGEYLVEPGKWETPHLMEHMLLGANERYPKSRIFQAEIEKNGAYSNASTSVYEISYEAECADFEWERVLDLMLLAITKPLFLADEFEAEAGNVREELTARSNNHFRHLSLALRERYGFMAKTDEERLKLMDNVSVADVREHYESTHTTKNLRFIIAGNLTPKRQETVQGVLERIGLPAGSTRIELPNEKPKAQPGPVYIHNKTVKNLYFYIDSFMLRRMSEPETDALNLVNTMLTETLYSKILGTARERGLVYGMSSGFGQTKLSSNWWFGAQVSQRNAAALFEIIIDELNNVFRGEIATEDIEAAKAYALGRFQRSAQTVSGVAGGYSGRYFFDGVVEDYYQVPRRIKAVTKTQIVETSRELFADNIWGLGILSNCEKPFASDLYKQITPLWATDEQPVKSNAR